MFRKSRSPRDAVRTALARREAAQRAVRRRGLYLMDLRVAIHHLRRAGAALRSAGPPPTDPDPTTTDATTSDLTNIGYLGRALELETALLVGIRDSRINTAESTYRDLVAHHHTQDATAAAVASLPDNVRSTPAGQSADVAEPVAFGLPVPLLADYLRPAMPPLSSCPHGHLGAAGNCLTPPCPADSAADAAG